MSNINAYGKTPTINTFDTKSVDGKNARKANGSELGMQDFLNLLTAQLANQDVMNPTNDTEFIAQMAQFSSLQAMQTLTELTHAQYGASMVGKNVLVASYDKNGQIVQETGVITKAKFMDGKVAVTINDKDYDLSQIMDVLHELPKEDDKAKSDNTFPEFTV